MSTNPKTHVGRAWDELAKPGPTDLHALTGELNGAGDANEFEIPSGSIPALDDLADQFLEAAEQHAAKHPVRLIHGVADDSAVTRVICLSCDLARNSDERDCPRCGEQAVMQA